MYTVRESGVLKQVDTWKVIIPRHDNEGNPFGDAMISDILEEIILRFPGFTLINCTGYWKGEERTYVDENIQLVVDVCPPAEGEPDELFAELKTDLAERLNQEKIYVTKEDSKSEFISFEEFFQEMGVEMLQSLPREAQYKKAQEIASRPDLILARLGYNTRVLRRNSDAGTIIWVRELSGIILTSEFVDAFPPDARLVAADRIGELSIAFGDVPTVIVGHYEFLGYAVTRRAQKPVADVCMENIADAENDRFVAPNGDIIGAKEFIERFVAAVFTNVAALRDEGFREEDITISVGSDGSLQQASGPRGASLLFSPACSVQESVQQEIRRCLREALSKWENGTLDPLAVRQAKARNRYVLKRAFLRKELGKAGA
jgi:hypothetical protein